MPSPFRPWSIVGLTGTVLGVAALTVLLVSVVGASRGSSRSGEALRPPARRGAQALAAPPPAHPGPPTVVIDPGHNGDNWRHTPEINRAIVTPTGKLACDTEGTTTLAGYTEAAFNLDVATGLAPVLSGRGLQVLLTRTDNAGWGPCIDERVAVANRARAAAVVSVHADGWKLGRGFYVLYAAPPAGSPDAGSPLAAATKRLALDIRDAYAQGTGMAYSNYAGHDSGLLVLPWPTLYEVPEVLIECGNMRSSADAALLQDPAYRSKAAQALANGVSAFLAGR